MKQLFLAFALAAVLSAQDAKEALGPKDNPNQKAPSPLAGLMSSLNSALLPALKGVHPRVYFTGDELAALRRRARTTHASLWQRATRQVRALAGDPPPPPAEQRRAQNEVGLAIAEAAFVYRIEDDRKYLDAARKYMDAATTYEIWGYPNNKPNVDLAAGHLLYGMGVGYDLLYQDLSPAERTKYRDSIAHHAQLMFDYFKPKSGRSYSYSQNHVFIPISGLAVAAYALYDESPQAPQWAALARAIMDRSLATYSQDGYYYEGFEYWIFSTPWLVHYLDAHKHATGEDLFDRPGLRQTHLYVAHSLVPGGHTIFDFGDVFEGPLTRAGQEPEYSRTHPGGKFYTNYNLLYDFAARFHDPQIQGIARWMDSLGHVNAEDWWSLAWYDDKLAATPMEKVPASHHFTDHDVVYWRTGWDANATALAFKCGPPEGHHTAAQLKQFPDWHLSAGHSHPDAASFILWAKGEYLTGDSGYSGVPKAEQHNLVLVGGRGQGFDQGDSHDPWDKFPYDRLNQVRITAWKSGAGFVEAEGDAAGAYDPALGLTRLHRKLRFENGRLTVSDQVELTRPQILTEFLHADEKVSAEGANRLSITKGKARLTGEWTASEPSGGAVEKNLVMAPGAPGSVNQGPVQQRGERLAVKTDAPVKSLTFQWVLQIR